MSCRFVQAVTCFLLLVPTAVQAAIPTTENFNSIDLTADSDGDNTRSFGASPRVINGWTFSIVDSGGNHAPDSGGTPSYLDVTGNSADTLLASPGDNALSVNGYFGVVTEARFSATSGDAFWLQSFQVQGGAMAPGVRVLGYRDGAQVASQDITVTGSVSTATTNHAGDQDWQNIDEFRIVQQNGDADILFFIDDITVTTAALPNATPTIGSLNGDSVAWAGLGIFVTLDSGGNADLGDTDLEALNGGSGDWSGASLTVQRPGTAVSTDTFGFNTAGALFTVSGGNLQSGGQTFATFTNTSGVLTISFTSSGTTATTALVNDIAQRITYRIDSPAGDAIVRFTLSDGTASASADVTVTTDSIYITDTTDTATVNVSNGVSFSEAVAIAAADGTGSQTLIFSNSFNGTMTLAGAVAINESLTVNGDSAGGLTISGSSIILGGGATLTFTNASGTVTIVSALMGTGSLTKAGAGILQLVGSHTYSGATNVNVGRLLVNGAVASGTTVATGATLGGSGTISSNVTVNTGGTLSPGNSPGTLTVNGNLTMASGSTLLVEINGTTAGTQYDQVIINGAVEVSGATLSATHGYSPGSGDAYTIIVNDAADAVTGSFSGLAEGATVAAGGNGTVLTASYIGGTGNDFTLTAPLNPTVISVSSISADSTYKIIDSVVMVVNFSEAVFLSTGTIQLILETGPTDRAATYLVGSGSSSISFSYTVQEGDISSDLDFTGTTALVANGDTIQSGSFVDANLTLPSPGTAGSIAASKDIVIDGIRPTASIVVADTALAAGETSTVTITFNEAVSGLAIGDFTVANGALSGLSSGDGGITWTATLTPTASITDTTNLITLNNTGVADSAGNTGTGTTDSNNYAIDTLRPTASIVVADTALAAGETSTVTITFNEAISGLTLDDFTTANATLSGLSTGDGGITWTATLTPIDNFTDTTNATNLNNAGVTDAAGNTGTGTTESNNYSIDTLRPTASIVVADTALAAGEISTVTITFSEAISGLAIGDFTVANGAISGLSSGDGGITWTATLTPTPSITDVSNVITLDNTGVADATGSTGTGTTDSNNYAIDTLRPTASIVVADAALAVGETSTVTITFNEAISGLAIGDFAVANGALSGLSTGDGGITWTATLTPASITDTSNVITLANTGVADAAGNTGTGTTDSNNYAIDSLRPTASIVVADTALAAGEASTVTITFNETVSGLTLDDFTTANATLSGLSTGDGGITWTATLTPIDNITSTTNAINLNNTAVTDVAGNTGTGTTESNNYSIDTLRPTASIVVADTALAAGETSTATITFSEAISGLAIADFTVANGAVSGLSSSDGGITWTATLTPTGSITDASNIITLDNTGVADAAGNIGTGTTDSNNYAIDTGRPTASIVVADAALAVGETSTVTITFNEAISGLALGDFTVANSVLNGLSSGDGGITWTATLTPMDSITDATNLITLNNTGVADAAGNTGTGTTESNNYSIDTLRPTASIVVADTALAAGETSTVTITFSEAVSGLAIGDFTATNAALSDLSTGDGGITWTANLTPTASIVATTNAITLDNTGVADAAGNTGTGTTESNNYFIDTARPTAAIIVADTTLSAGETSTVTIIFDEAVNGLAIDDFTVANGALSGLSTSDGGNTWTATLTPAAGLEAATNLIVLDNTGVLDTTGSTGTGTTSSDNYAIDTLRPTASIVVADSTLVAGETSTVTITFSEAVSGLTVADLAVENGALSDLASSDGGITWTALLTTSPVVAAGNVITLDNSGVMDAAGNAGSGSSLSNPFDITAVLYTVGGTVTGLDSGANLVLQLNGGDDELIDSNGAFAFATGLAEGVGYAVSVSTHPSGQICGVDNGSGLMDAADVTNVTVTCTTAGVAVIVNPTTGLETSEEGGSDIFTIVLAVQPTADVVIGLSSSDTAEGAVAPENVTFTSENWNVAQTVTVTGVDDDLADGDQAFAILTSATASADPVWAGLAIEDVTATNIDDETTAADSDGDGVPNEVEDGGPNGGDGNGDGIPDSTQPNIATFPAANGNGFITLSATCELRDVRAVAKESLPPTQLMFPFALLEFRLPCPTADMTVLFHAGTGWRDGFGYWKYGPETPGQALTTKWYELDGAVLDTTTVATVTVARARFTLIDGQLGDDTGIDGQIIDQGGPAVPAPAASIPTVSEWMMIMMAMLLAAAGVLKLR